MNIPVQVGDSFVTAQLSPCVGGLVRTWTDSELGRPWAVDDASHQLSIQGTGTISRTLHAVGRFRETAAESGCRTGIRYRAAVPHAAKRLERQSIPLHTDDVAAELRLRPMPSDQPFDVVGRYRALAFGKNPHQPCCHRVAPAAERSSQIGQVTGVAQVTHIDEIT